MRIASIDIGTNTVLLLVVEIDRNRKMTILEDQQRLPRLGKDVDARGAIGPTSFQRVVDVLDEYKTICDRLKPDKVVAVGTSAVRDAANRKEFSAYVRSRTGINIEIVNGEEEARLAYIGALSGFPEIHAGAAVIDIGGGSTEITTGTSEKILTTASVDIGSVRITERFFKHNPPMDDELRDAEEFIGNALQKTVGTDLAGSVVVGVAGTATTLAALDIGLAQFDRIRISGHRLTRTAVHSLLGRLKKMTVNEILSLSTMTHGRADILTAGTLILHTFMNKTNVTGVTVSERGIRYGLALRALEESRPAKNSEGR
jgi:exopolyphosphatase/guanosine-5'-triphosphate,3'-diphosphate pyrophosphatase